MDFGYWILALIFGAIVILQTADRLEALECFQCTDCGDEFHSKAIGVSKEWCPEGSCQKTKMGHMVVRQCSKEKKDNICVGKGSNWECYCNSYLCNGSEHVSTSTITLLLMFLVRLF